MKIFEKEINEEYLTKAITYDDGVAIARFTQEDEAFTFIQEKSNNIAQLSYSGWWCNDYFSSQPFQFGSRYGETLAMTQQKNTYSFTLSYEKYDGAWSVYLHAKVIEMTLPKQQPKAVSQLT